MLCSVVKHAGSDRARKKCRGKHETYSSVFFLLLECSEVLYNEERAQSRLLFLFYDKESYDFPTHSDKFSSQTLYSKRGKVASAVLCSPIKHTEISQSQSLLEQAKVFNWQTRRQLSIKN